MSISSVNPYMSMMAAYKAATADNKQSNTPLDTVENTQAKATTRPGDTVSISQEASQKSRAEQYALKDDPIELFNEWKYSGSDRPMVHAGPKPWEQLLPENQDLIAKMKEQAKGLPEEERRLMLGRISFVESYGDKEIFTSVDDVDSRQNAGAQAMSLSLAYLTSKNGEFPLKEMEFPSGLKNLGDLTGKAPEKSIGGFEKFLNIPVSNFDDQEFLESLLFRA